ncbi:MAG: diguanylate cyclase [Wolbachia sp.]
MILNIDYFKIVNDDFGHTAVDKLLKQMQKRISENIRVTDLLARFCGEEFTTLMPDTNISDACTVTERIRELLSQNLLCSQART